MVVPKGTLIHNTYHTTGTRWAGLDWIGFYFGLAIGWDGLRSNYGMTGVRIMAFFFFLFLGLMLGKRARERPRDTPTGPFQAGLFFFWITLSTYHGREEDRTETHRIG